MGGLEYDPSDFDSKGKLPGWAVALIWIGIIIGLFYLSRGGGL